MVTTKIINPTDNHLIFEKTRIVLTVAESNGIDMEKVVAVAAINEKTAIKSIT